MQIDINCDLGEGIGNDEAIMPFISSANIACGFHAGNDIIMEKTIQLALQHEVAIGAHPGYNDKPNFGRKNISLSYKEVKDLTKEQINILNQKVLQAGATLHHVKPHGALYNQASRNIDIAKAIAEAIASVNKDLIYVGLANSKMEMAAKEFNLKFRAEAFTDRAYTNLGLLVPRKEPGAVITNVEYSKERALKIAQHKTIQTIDQKEIIINAQSLCIHGDNPHAIAVAKNIYEYLIQNNIKITAHV
ncbi:5-oxoprolinase subunit PxpA [Plebeiibacterium sediminum]|uniref:LamB/YcsF family protein n=1 Tax=Plebeiibacterium sediminum TaxID=2992112 RepID=A0AAE3M3F8_9BACT|nr:5-oxoprolinase subunit PxpA [Plebeiobacterium sediminum]MCW3786144.1 LamB/YcsF family protein [Plebeiobacterium sediminum]